MDAIGGSGIDHVVDRESGERLAPLVGLVSIPNGGCSCDSFKQLVEEKDHLLVLVNVDSSVVV